MSAKARTTVQFGDGPEIEVDLERLKRVGQVPRADPLNEFSNAAPGKLRSLVERIERLNEDKAAVMADLKEVFTEAKGEGFDTKILRSVIRLRAEDRAKRQEREALIDLYMSVFNN